MPSGLILGIESSCDETAAAVVRHGTHVLSNVIASQVDLHALYGGVVPELASREHLRNIVPVVREAIARAGITFADLDAVAVTEGPGLAGALLVGILYAKALAFALDKPLIAINHLEGHIHAVLLESQANLPRPQPAGPTAGLPSAQHEAAAASPAAILLPSQASPDRTLPTQPTITVAASLPIESPLSIDAPLLALVVSGGHTHLYLAHAHPVTGAWTYENIGRTVDDAAGEAFDKVAKLLGLGYPGGPWIDALAPHGDPRAVAFQFHSIKPREDAQPDQVRYDFSFSGIKTAVLRYTQTHNLAAAIENRRQALGAAPALKPRDAASLCDQQTLDLIASFQSAVVGNLLRQTFAAAEAHGVRGLLVSGGVAANQELRRRFQAEAARHALPVAFPSITLSTDNAAMIAAAAWPHLLTHDYAPESMSAAPQLRMG